MLRVDVADCEFENWKFHNFEIVWISKVYRQEKGYLWPKFWCLLVTKLCPTRGNSVNCSHRQAPLPWGLPAKNTRVGCHALLQGIFLSQGKPTHLEPDILECKVRWALGSIITSKASRGDGIPIELFHILRGDAVKVLHSICQQIWRTQQWLQDWKRSVSFQSQRKALAKNAQITAQFHSSHTLAK